MSIILKRCSFLLRVFLVGLCILCLSAATTASADSGTYVNRHYYPDGTYSKILNVEMKTPVVWTANQGPYVIEGWVTILDGGSLTIEAGTKILCGPSDVALQSNITVNDNGKLIIAGTKENPITMTSNQATPKPGDWAYIYIKAKGSASIEGFNASFGGNWDGGIIRIESPEVSVTDCTITDSSNHGILVNAQGIDPSIENVTFARNASFDVKQSTVDANPSYKNLKTDDPYKGLIIYGANFGGQIEWDDPGIPILADGWFVARGPSASLTIHPGVTIWYRPVGTALQSNLAAYEGGKLIIKGTQDKPIVMTSANKEKKPGDWAYMEIGDEKSSGELEYVNASYGGNWGRGFVSIYSPNVSVKNCNFSQSSSFGVALLKENITPTIQNINFTGNADYDLLYNHVSVNPSIGGIKSDKPNKALHVPDGHLTTNVTWNNPGVPYTFSGWLMIDNGGSLTVGPGVQVRITAIGSALQSNIVANSGGKLNINGTAAEPILFTSAEAKPAAGQWAYIGFGKGALGSAKYAVIEYAGNWGRGAMYAEDNISISNCTFRNNADFAIKALKGAKPILTNNVFEQTNVGGVSNDTPTNLVDATSCFWGDATGPQNDKTNPKAKGVKVSDGVKYLPYFAGVGGKLVSGTASNVEKKLISIVPSKLKATIKPGASLQITLTAAYTDGKKEPATLFAKWSSSNNAVATVSNGKIKGLKKGKAVISAIYSGKTVKVTIEVK